MAEKDLKSLQFGAGGDIYKIHDTKARTDLDSLAQQVNELEQTVEGIDVPSVDGLASEEYVDNAIEALNIPSVEGLATEQYVDNAIEALEIPDTSNLQSKIDAQHKLSVDLVDGALKSSDIEGLASEEYVDGAIETVEGQIPDVSGLATKDEVEAVEQQIPSVEGLATETYVDNAVNGLATEQYVDEAIAGIEVPLPDNVVTTEEHEFNTITETTIEVPAVIGHLYKGKRYTPGATADDGTTMTTKERKISSYIPLALEEGGITYLPIVWGAAGANYTEICLFAGVDGHEPADTAQAVLDTKKSGQHASATSVTGPLTLIADTSIGTYTFDTANQIIRFNPAWAQYIRTYVTDDSTIARANYTVRVKETLEVLDVTNGVIKSTEEVTPATHEINGFMGSVYYKNLSDDTQGYVVLQNTGTVSISPASAPSGAMVAKIDSSITASKPTRFYTNPIQLKYDGVCFDVNTEDVLDFNGAGYMHVAFLDSNWNVVDGVEGINGSGTHAIKHMEIIRDENAQSLTVVTTPSVPEQTGDITSQIITVPTSYQYVIVCMGKTIQSCTQLIASQTMTQYTYIGEPAHGEQIYHESETFIGQQLGKTNTSYSVSETHIMALKSGVTGTTGSGSATCVDYFNPTFSVASNVRIQTKPILLDDNFDGLIVDAQLLDTTGAGFGVVTFLDENYNVTELVEGITGMGACAILTNEMKKDATISQVVIDSEPSPSASGGNIQELKLRYPANSNYKYVVCAVTGSFSGTPEQFEQQAVKVQYHYIGEYAEPETIYTKLEDYIDSKVPTTINDKYTWSRMYGADVCLFGGSFATATYGQKAHEYWAEKLNINLTNYAVGGAGTILNVGTTPMQTQVTQMINAGKKYDLYILWCSTNDQRKVGDAWTSGASQTIQGNTYAGADFNAEVIGAVDDTARTSQSGGMNWIFNQIYTFDPNAKIIVFTSMRHFATGPSGRTDNGYNDLYTDGSSVRHFVDAQIATCNYWSIPYVDQYRVWGVNTLNKSTFVRSDNLHPTDAGYIRIAALQVELMANM